MLLKALPVVCTHSLPLPALPEEYKDNYLPRLHTALLLSYPSTQKNVQRLYTNTNYPTECEELEFKRIWALGWERIHTS